MPRKPIILQVVLPVPMHQVFDYLLADAVDAKQVSIGARVRVPFGRRQLIGVVVGVSTQSAIAKHKLKKIIHLLDSAPILPKAILNLLKWTSQYYHHPLGETVLGSLPTVFREGLDQQAIQQYQLTAKGEQTDPKTLKRAPKQQALLTHLQQAQAPISQAVVDKKNGSRVVLKALIDKQLITKQARYTTWAQQTSPTATQPVQPLAEKPIKLNAAQQQAYAAISEAKGYQTFCLDGVTGSGKTEVYLQVIADVLKQDQQALVLVPEIALTPQTVTRFQKRFNAVIVVLHSNLSAKQRAQDWIAAAQQQAQIVIGTRSAIFVPLPACGVIILDEEHDDSFKQQSACRYSARDVAIVRAHADNIPVILGSATPSLETLYNCQQKRYQHLHLPERAGKSKPANFQLIDLRREQGIVHGLSTQLCQAIDRHLSADNQVLLFLNRRGYAPVLLCHQCGWSAQCTHCDAKLIFHSQVQQLRCHHCGQVRRVPQVCPECQSIALINLGLGTQRIEQALAKRFPGVECVRIDRDTTRRKNSLDNLLTQINCGRAQLLIGTQMLAKGHHFPQVTLVGIIDVDSGLYSADFKAIEKLAQLIIQVAGRAGRGDQTGEVYLQTHQPENPLLQCLIRAGFNAFAQAALSERQQACLPPFAHLALIHVRSKRPDQANDFLNHVQHYAQACAIKEVEIFDPVPAPMARKAGFYRAQLLLHALQRKPLQKLLAQLTPQLSKLATAHKVRFAIDVDPVTLG